MGVTGRANLSKKNKNKNKKRDGESSRLLMGFIFFAFEINELLSIGDANVCGRGEGGVEEDGGLY